MSLKEIKPKDLEGNPFSMIGRQWMLITAEKDGSVNTMTASWGGMGVLWGKDVVFAFIRPQRYTKNFVDSTDRFSLTFFNDSCRKTLAYLGSVSGRDEDKIGKSGFHLSHVDGVPSFDEAAVTIIARKLYVQELKPELFLDANLREECYPEQDFHTMYVAEVEKLLVRG